jgi:oxygen-dependent protoporphyrinogen oxidase
MLLSASAPGAAPLARARRAGAPAAASLTFRTPAAAPHPAAARCGAPAPPRRRRGAAAAAAPAAAAPATTPAAADDAEPYDVVVVGAGISGLTTALALRAQHAAAAPRVLVTEGRERVGGNVTTVADGPAGYLWEEGPNSFQPSDAILRAAVDAGCVDDLVLGDPTAPRFVFWEGRLRPTPSGPDAVTFDLMSILGKIRAGLGALGVKKPLPGALNSFYLFYYYFFPFALDFFPLIYEFRSCSALSRPHTSPSTHHPPPTLRPQTTRRRSSSLCGATSATRSSSASSSPSARASMRAIRRSSR